MSNGLRAVNQAVASSVSHSVRLAFLVVFLLLTAKAAEAIGYCSEPSPPSCLSIMMIGDRDEFTFTMCRSSMESYRSDVGIILGRDGIWIAKSPTWKKLARQIKVRSRNGRVNPLCICGALRVHPLMMITRSFWSVV
jgi:hypothetical protein